jgi:hypothetical protein
MPMLRYNDSRRRYRCGMQRESISRLHPLPAPFPLTGATGINGNDGNRFFGVDFEGIHPPGQPPGDGSWSAHLPPGSCLEPRCFSPPSQSSAWRTPIPLGAI